MLLESALKIGLLPLRTLSGREEEATDAGNLQYLLRRKKLFKMIVK